MDLEIFEAFRAAGVPDDKARGAGAWRERSKRRRRQLRAFRDRLGVIHRLGFHGI